MMKRKDAYKVKSGNVESDICSILGKLLRVEQERIDSMLQKLASRTSGTVEEKASMGTSDANIAAYRRMKADPAWLNRHLGHYVVFVDGELVGTSKDRKSLLEEGRQEFPDRPRFFTKVEADEPMVHIPSPFFVEDM